MNRRSWDPPQERPDNESEVSDCWQGSEKGLRGKLAGPVEHVKIGLGGLMAHRVQ